MLFYNRVYVHWFIKEIGFVLHKRLIATKTLIPMAQGLEEKREFILKEHEERVFLMGV